MIIFHNITVLLYARSNVALFSIRVLFQKYLGNCINYIYKLKQMIKKRQLRHTHTHIYQTVLVCQSYNEDIWGLPQRAFTEKFKLNMI